MLSDEPSLQKYRLVSHKLLSGPNAAFKLKRRYIFLNESNIKILPSL